MSDFSKIILHPAKERSILNRHPWLFSGAINKLEGEVKEGDVVEIYSADQRYLATGHYHEGSITARIFSFEKTIPNFGFWKSKLQKAFTYRQKLGLTNNDHTNAYRLVNAEGDEMPGLIIDIYNSTAVLQTHTVGMYQVRDHLVKSLQELYKNNLTSIFDKSGDTLGKHSLNTAINKSLVGEKTEEEILENNIRFYVNFSEGQKTGFFLDQRDNRQLLGEYAAGKKVLNTFAYSGGFSLYALKNNAALVHSVDSSMKGEEWAKKSSALNSFATEGNVSNRHKYFVEDVFHFFKQAQQTYDLIVLDPPAFAKRISAVKQAAQGYRNLNYEALKRIANGGILFTFSCSQVVDKELFRKIVFSAAAQARRTVRIMHQLTQPADHPISLFHPEGEYLKGLVLYVGD